MEKHIASFLFTCIALFYKHTFPFHVTHSTLVRCVPEAVESRLWKEEQGNMHSERENIFVCSQLSFSHVLELGKIPVQISVFPQIFHDNSISLCK